MAGPPVRFHQLRDKAWLKTQLDSGLRHGEIAAELGCSTVQVRRWANEHGLTKPAGEFPQLRDKAWLKARISEGASWPEVAEQVGCSLALVQLRAKQHGLLRPALRHPLLGDAGWLRERYLNEKLTCPEIGEQVGCSASAVLAALGRAGIPTRDSLSERERMRHRRVYGKIDAAAAVAAYQHGDSLSVLAKRYGVSRRVVEAVISAAGVSLRTRSEANRLSMAYRKRPTGVRDLKRLIAQDDLCAFCGEGENIEQHHLNGVRSDHRPENLVPLCRDCHAKVEWLVHHATEGLRRAYRGEEPDLRLPA